MKLLVHGLKNISSRCISTTNVVASRASSEIFEAMKAKEEELDVISISYKCKVQPLIF